MKNQRGQGLIEYLIIVALMAVATIGIVRVMGQSVSAQLANVTLKIQGSSKKAAKETVDESLYKKRDLSDFFNGAASK